MSTAAIIGSGNIGTDLLLKLQRSPHISVRYVIGADPASEGLARANELGIETSTGGLNWLLSRNEPPGIVFDATSSAVHAANAPRYAAAGILAIDLTPAAVGPFLCPPVNLGQHLCAPNVNMITCGGQATIPIVRAVSRVTPVNYAEIVASIASRSAGPGTRANIDEFVETTASAIESVGGADRAKAIIVLNPAQPPTAMRNTVFCAVAPDADVHALFDSIADMVAAVQQYVPGYRLAADPQFEPSRPEWRERARVSVLLEVRGAGDYLPPWAGNLDIMTAAAARAGELIAQARNRTGKVGVR